MHPRLLGLNLTQERGVPPHYYGPMIPRRETSIVSRGQVDISADNTGNNLSPVQKCALLKLVRAKYKFWSTWY